MSRRGGRGASRGCFGRGGRGKGGDDGAWTWVAASGRGRGRRGRGDRDFDGHDNRAVQIKQDQFKSNRVGAFGKGFKGKKGKGKGKNKDLEGVSCLVHSNSVERVDEESIGRHCEIRSAHKQAIEAITMTEQGVYTASQDRTLKRWKPVKRPDGRFELNPEITIPLSDSCFSLLFSAGWLFCGLWDGSVRAFHQDGTEATLTGHTRRITSIITHQNVLITGSVDHEVRLWQMDPATKRFACTHTLTESMPGAILKLHVLGEHLFVGGMNGLAMVNLAKLEVTKLLPPTKPVADFLEFQGHLIVAYQEGGLRIFDSTGECKSEKPPLAAGPILSIAGLESGPRVLIGHAKGQVSSIELPSFGFKTQFQAAVNTKVNCVYCAGHDGIFLLGFSDGSLQLWQRVG